ncbi:MAG TPA: hypothetical protein VJH24_03980 [Candidatus Bilamarchaeaceae archaeon]|nr:hypothetical protein [Candidatus Bilamarchaeaceae archaeon]
MFAQFLFARFGIQLPDGLIFIERKKHVYVAKKELGGVSYPRLNRAGMIAGKKESIFGPKPSLDFVLTFGHLAIKNTLPLSDDEIRKFYQNEKINMDKEGLIIVQNAQGKGAALGHGKDGWLTPLIPKQRLVKLYKDA